MSAPREIRRVLLVHPSGLMYSEVYLRLEPLGLELVAAACRKNGYRVRLIDLQASSHKEYFRTIQEWRPDEQSDAKRKRMPLHRAFLFLINNDMRRADPRPPGLDGGKGNSYWDGERYFTVWAS